MRDNCGHIVGNPVQFANIGTVPEQIPNNDRREEYAEFCLHSSDRGTRRTAGCDVVEKEARDRQTLVRNGMLFLDLKSDWQAGIRDLPSCTLPLEHIPNALACLIAFVLRE